MIEKPMYAQQNYNEYFRQARTLINTYCQIRTVRPMEPLPKLSREIWRLQALVWIWAVIVRANGDQRYMGER